MSKISEEVSQIVEVRIPEGKWKTYLPALDAQRKVYGLNSIKILFTICEAVEEQEKLNKSLDEKIKAFEELFTKLQEERHDTNPTKHNTKKSV